MKSKRRGRKLRKTEIKIGQKLIVWSKEFREEWVGIVKGTKMIGNIKEFNIYFPKIGKTLYYKSRFFYVFKSDPNKFNPSRRIMEDEV